AANTPATEHVEEPSHTASKEHAFVFSEPTGPEPAPIEPVGTSQPVPESIVNSATQEIPIPARPKIEWAEPPPEPVEHVRVPDFQRDPTIEPVTYIPAPALPRSPEVRTAAPSMWTETPRSTTHTETGEVPAFATFFDNSFEQYRQIVESLNKQPVAIERPI